MSKRVAILGATGYAGETTTDILLRHPQIELVHLGSDRLAGEPYASAVPAFAGRTELQLSPDTTQALLASEPDGIVLAKKSPDVTRLVPELLAAGIKLVDIGTEFRLRDLDNYLHWYHGPHACPELLNEAVYGLTEWHREAIRQARVVGNPGCYATSMLLPLLPLLADGLLDLAQQIVAIGYSGVSGAGKQYSDKNNTLFWACNENLRGYKALAHQHQAEVDQELSLAATTPVHIHFAPHLAPITRGILTTISARLRPGQDLAAVQASWRRHYQDSPFIRLRADAGAVEVAHVVGSNFCDFGAAVAGDCLIIESAEDNLVKGAAGQAVQNLNLMLNLPENLGLL